MARVYSDPAKWAEAVRRWEQRELAKPILAGLRRGASIWRKTALLDFQHRGVGAKVARDPRGRKRWWGISIDRTKRIGETRYQTGLLLYGLAAHQEMGTATRPHKISGKGNNFLVFEATGRRLAGFGPRRSGLIAVRQVNHPGGRVPRYPFARRTAQLVEPRMQAEVQRGVVESANQVIG
jgi:hypothetical protein